MPASLCAERKYILKQTHDDNNWHFNVVMETTSFCRAQVLVWTLIFQITLTELFKGRLRIQFDLARSTIVLRVNEVLLPRPDIHHDSRSAVLPFQSTQDSGHREG